jgi:hypothetical protein
MKGWQKDKAASDIYLPTIKAILGQVLIGEPPIEEDQDRNTDLIVLRMQAIRIACRVRTHEYLGKYSDEFTIRATRPSGRKTELAKIVEGWGDYIFYGFAAPNGTGLAKWAIGDLNVFRLWFSRYMANNNGTIPGRPYNNGDGSSGFRVFKWGDIPYAFNIANGADSQAKAIIKVELEHFG